MSERRKLSQAAAEESAIIPTPIIRPRILALDVGTKRIGLAISDALGITVQGLQTLNRRDKLHDLNDLEGVLRKFHVDEIVVGHPVKLDGSASAQTEKVLKFVELIKTRFDLPVHLWDERLTSVEAEEVLKQRSVSVERGDGSVDRVAAEIILRDYLEHRFGSEGSLGG